MKNIEDFSKQDSVLLIKLMLEKDGLMAYKEKVESNIFAIIQKINNMFEDSEKKQGDEPKKDIEKHDKEQTNEIAKDA